MSKFHNKNTVYISNVEILISDIDKSLSLYNDILGFKVLKRENGRVELTTNNKDSLLTLVEQKKCLTGTV